MEKHRYKPNLRLKGFRESLGLSQEEFGRRTGMEGNHICTMETGAERLGVARAMRICKTFRRQLVAAGISFEDLIRAQQ